MADLAEPPPPSYDDVVNPSSNGQPTAPPAHHLPPSQPAPAGNHGGYGPPTHPAQPATGGARRESGPATSGTTKSKTDRAIEAYVSFSTAHLLRMNIEPSSHGHLDPELDVEAQFSRPAVRSQQKAIAMKQRKQCVSGWLWCFGVIQTLFYIGLPVAMIILGILGLGDDCPFRNDIILGYLFAGGSILAVTGFFRAVPSCMTCARNRNVCNTKNSGTCAGSICACECLFFLFFIANLGVLVFGTYAVFDERPDTSCDIAECMDDFCSFGIYAGSATCVIFQYILYSFSIVYLCLVVYCNRKWAKEY